jgi:hypothetical protein
LTSFSLLRCKAQTAILMALATTFSLFCKAFLKALYAFAKSFSFN